MSQLWSGSHIRRANSVSAPGSHRTPEPRGRTSNTRSPPWLCQRGRWTGGSRDPAPTHSERSCLSFLKLSKHLHEDMTPFGCNDTFSCLHELHWVWGKEISKKCKAELCTLQRCESHFTVHVSSVPDSRQGVISVLVLWFMAEDSNACPWPCHKTPDGQPFKFSRPSLRLKAQR